METPTLEQLPEHWQTGCSNAKRWVECPGSKYAVDDRDPGQAALRGTLGHKICEQLLDGLTVELDEADQALLDEMSADEKSVFIDKVMACFDFVQEHLRFADEVRIETKIKSNRIPNHGGTVDVILWFEKSKTLHVVDFKFGSTPVMVAENYQLAAYLNLAWQLFPKAEIFYGSIVQPAFRGVESAEFPAEWLADWLVKAAVAADPDNMALNADPSWCEYCPLLTECKEAAKLGRSAAEEFDAVKAEPVMTQERVERLEWLLRVFKMASKAEREVTAMLKKAFDDGFNLTAHKMTTKTDRSWKPEALKDEILEPLVEPALPSPAKVQKLLKMNKKEFDDTFGGMLDLSRSRVLRVGSKPLASALDEFEPS